MSTTVVKIFAVLIGFFWFGDVALAAVEGLPWEDSVDKLVNSLTGPVGKGITVVAICFTGGMLAFGSELSGIAKAGLSVGMAGSLIMGAVQLVDKIFSEQGAIF